VATRPGRTRPLTCALRSRRPGARAVAAHDSVTDYDAAERIIQTAIDSFGQIDILVNNAGIVRRPHVVK